MSDDTRELPELRLWRETGADGAEIINALRSAPMPHDEAAVRAADLLERLATTSPAVIVAASSGDVEVLSGEFRRLIDADVQWPVSRRPINAAMSRATIVDSATHVVLPREALERAIDLMEARAMDMRHDIDDPDACPAQEAYEECGQTLRALLGGDDEY